MSKVASVTRVPVDDFFGQGFALTITRHRVYLDDNLVDKQNSAGAGGSSRQEVITVAPGRRTGATVARTYRELWYNQIQVIPSRVDFGNIAGARTAEVEVWNAFQEPSRLEAVRLGEAQGLGVQEPRASPTTYAPLESLIYTVKANGDGPPAINTKVTYDWLFTSIDIPITGQRLVPWPFPLNWSGNLVEMVSYKTEILTAWNGKEQRIRHRNNPRRIYEGDYAVTGREAQQLLAVLWSWQARNYAVPLWHQRETITGAIASGDKIIPVKTANLEIQVGGTVGLYRSWDRFEVLVVDAVTETSVSVTQGIEMSWEPGDAFFPVSVARLEDSQTVDLLSDRTATLSARWRALDVYAPTTQERELSYKGKSVLIDRPNWRQPPSVDFDRNILNADYGWLPAFDDPRERGQTTYTFLYTLDDRATIQWYRRWLHERRGRQRSFWIPTWWDDMDLLKPINAGETAIETKILDAETNFGDRGRSHLFIETTFGTIYLREILSISTNSVEEKDVLSLDDSIPDDVAISEIQQLGFLVECRLDADRVEFRHVTDHVAEVELPVRMI